MLYWFEEIDDIARLERQINVYEQRNEEVGKRREEAKHNWDQVQQLHDLWLYRTLPSLSILGKIVNHLTDEDMKQKEALQSPPLHGREDRRCEFLRLANQSLYILGERLGPLEDWRRGGPLAEEWKKSVGRQLKSCEGESDLGKLLGRLPVITQDLSLLDDMTPPTASFHTTPSPSFNMSACQRAASPTLRASSPPTTSGTGRIRGLFRSQNASST